MSRLEELIGSLCPDGVPYRKLGEIAAISRGGNLQKKTSAQMVFPAFTTDKSIPDTASLLIQLSLLSVRTAPKSKSWPIPMILLWLLQVKISKMYANVWLG